jgi:hypothetical protein
MPLNPNAASIVYQATSKLLDLVTSAIRTRNREFRKDNYAKAAKIRYLLKGYAMYPTYISVDNANQILQCLINTSGIQEFPTPPSLPAPSNPASSSLLRGDAGPIGPRGNDGGATDFVSINVNGNTVVDTFPLGSAYAARWDYIVNGSAQRAGTIYATWTEDGSLVSTPAEAGTDDVNGSTNAVTFTVTVVSGNVRLNANVTSGIWDIRGSRYFIPNQGAGVNPTTAPLPDGNIWVGNASNLPTAVPVTGDVSISNTGVVSFTPAVIVDADVNASANITLSKLASVPNNNAVVLSNGSGKITSIANGSSGQVLTISGGVPVWAAPGTGGTVTNVSATWSGSGITLNVTNPTTTPSINVSGTLVATSGGTGQNFFADGDLLVGTSSNTLIKRAIGTTNQVLTVVGGFPVWAAIPVQMPIGGIIMWSGSILAIPAGYALCDGTSGTPDLRGRFIVGAGGSYSIGNTGGSETVTLTTSQIPAHTHGVSDPGHTHTLGRPIASSDSGTGALDEGSGSAFTPVSSSSTTGISILSEGGGGSHENRPPYYALAYIMRIS